MQIIVRSVLLLGAALAGESIAAIASPATREILTDSAIALRFFAVHQELATVINLRNATRGHEESHALLELGDTAITFMVKTAHIVVIQKDEQVVRVFVQKVLRQSLINLEDALRVLLLVVANLVERILANKEEVEVHRGLEVGLRLT